MSQTIYTINAPSADHLAEVMAEMETLGSPKIRAVFCGDHYKAIEGSHRVAAAHKLGIEVEIIEMEMSDVITDHDIDDLESSCTVEEIIDYACWTAAAYMVEVI